MSPFRRRLMMQKKGGGLPVEYQQVEYLESNGVQFLNIGVPSYRNGLHFGYIIDFQYTSFPSPSYVFAPHVWRLHHYSGVLQLLWDNKQFNLWSGQTDRHLYEVNYMNSGVAIRDNEKLSSNLTYEYKNIMDLVLFNSSLSRVYSLVVSLGAELVRDFLPCYRKSDNKPGLYDLVNGEFYTNQGKGEFIVGPDI